MELVNGQYSTSGNVLKEIAKEFDAPVYVYDRNSIVNHYNTLKQAFAPLDIKVKYACKALNNAAILKLLKKQGCGLDTVSINEVLLGLRAWLEPGNYLVSESGYFLVKVIILKQTTATVFVGVDSGLYHLIRTMLYDSYHHIVNLSNPEGKQRIYTVVGYICETDTFGWDRKINEVHEGDILCFKNAGAYGIAMSSNYNARFKPAEVLIYNDKVQLIRKRETMEDLIRNEVDAHI